MFSRVLVANRGEIAVRVIRAAARARDRGGCRVLDRGSRLAARRARRPGGLRRASRRERQLSEDLERHRRRRDDGVRSGASRLRVPRRDADFVRACDDSASAPWARPRTSSSRWATSCGEGRDARGLVYRCAGFGDQTGLAGLRRAAADTGFPILLKAAAGGGGKGMRTVTSADDLEDAFGAASAEADAAFGDGSIYVEKLVSPPATSRSRSCATPREAC